MKVGVPLSTHLKHGALDKDSQQKNQNGECDMDENRRCPTGG